MAQLEIRNVTRRFGDFVAVVDVSFEIKSGEFFTLLGPSGCGKTTLLRMVAGFDLPDRGSIVLDGVDLKDTPAERRPIHTVFQSYALFPHMTVADNVGYGLSVTGVARPEIERRTLAAMDSVGLSGYGQRLPSELSGGQQQRVAVARALVLEPSVMLFDEPLSNLDARLRRSMREEIRSLQQRLGLTVAYVTHDQSEALAVSDQIVVMDAGRIAQAGSPRQLYEHPCSEFVAAFMGEAMLFVAEAGQDGVIRLGPLRLPARRAVAPGPGKGGGRPGAWQGGPETAPPGLPGDALAGTLLKSAYLGGLQELTIATEIGELFVVSPDVRRGWAVGQALALSLGGPGVSVLETG